MVSDIQRLAALSAALLRSSEHVPYRWSRRPVCLPGPVLTILAELCGARCRSILVLTTHHIVSVSTQVGLQGGLGVNGPFFRSFIAQLRPVSREVPESGSGPSALLSWLAQTVVFCVLVTRPQRIIVTSRSGYLDLKTRCVRA